MRARRHPGRRLAARPPRKPAALPRDGRSSAGGTPRAPQLVAPAYGWAKRRGRWGGRDGDAAKRNAGGDASAPAPAGEYRPTLLPEDTLKGEPGRRAGERRCACGGARARPGAGAAGLGPPQPRPGDGRGPVGGRARAAKAGSSGEADRRRRGEGPAEAPAEGAGSSDDDDDKAEAEAEVVVAKEGEERAVCPRGPPSGVSMAMGEAPSVGPGRARENAGEEAVA